MNKTDHKAIPIFEIEISNIGPLEKIYWKPTRVCALIGANGAGKSTLFSVLQYLHDLYCCGPTKAAKALEEAMRRFSPWTSEAPRISIRHEGFHWMIEFLASDFKEPVETLFFEDEMIFTSVPYKKEARVKRVLISDRQESALRAVELPSSSWDAERAQSYRRIDICNHTSSSRLGWFVTRIRTLKCFDRHQFRQENNGSDQGESRTQIMQACMWRDEECQRRTFVRGWMGEIFPRMLHGLHISVPGLPTPIWIIEPEGKSGESVEIKDAPKSLASTLLMLCALAVAEEGSVIAIDEPENGLHPLAIRRLVAAARQEAGRKNLTVILATHSPVIVNEFATEPEQLYILQKDLTRKQNPVPVNVLHSNYIARLHTQTLFESGELGSNDKDAKGSRE